MQNTDIFIETDVIAQEPPWEELEGDLLPLIPKIINEAAGQSPLAKTLAGRSAEISVVLSNDSFVRALNRQYRGKDKATNVLSFQQTDIGDLPPPGAGPLPLGDIILAYETIANEAKEQGKSFKAHCVHLVVHGTLHIFGYDHETEDDAEIMETLEINILKRMGIKNPYVETNFMA